MSFEAEQDEEVTLWFAVGFCCDFLLETQGLDCLNSGILTNFELKRVPGFFSVVFMDLQSHWSVDEKREVPSFLDSRFNWWTYSGQWRKNCNCNKMNNGSSFPSDRSWWFFLPHHRKLSRFTFWRAVATSQWFVHDKENWMKTKA